MYRPEGWENPYPTYNDSQEELGNTCGFDCEYHAYEAGANAMLKALLAGGEYAHANCDESCSERKVVTIRFIPEE